VENAFCRAPLRAMTFDVAIVGGGPAGAACASFCAQDGLRVLVLERETFPREKVCGDCLNPACWEILRRLGLAEKVRTLPCGQLDRVEFIAIDGKSVTLDLPSGIDAEIAVKRSFLDQLLLNRAHELGAEVHHSATVTALQRDASGIWNLRTADQTFSARAVIGADGRNSTVARLCNLLPKARRERVALQTHLPLPTDFGNRVVLQFLKEGYSGQAPVGEEQLNVCLVAGARDIEALKVWATKHFNVSPSHSWRTITPLTRAPLPAAHDHLLFIGDAARVVEPFTGEGIYYALASGELAAKASVRIVRGENQASVLREFTAAHTSLYRGRLWINRLARAAVLSPRLASLFVHAARVQPSILRMLTAKIVG
jgi:menaquinone-9 beta-reductase